MPRYDFVKKFVMETEPKSIVDLGCAECKFVKEIATWSNAKRIIGVDFDPKVLDDSRRVFNSKFDSNYNQGFRRKEDTLLQVLLTIIVKQFAYYHTSVFLRSGLCRRCDKRGR